MQGTHGNCGNNISNHVKEYGIMENKKGDNGRSIIGNM
jgi:hypothetical protein